MSDSERTLEILNILDINVAKCRSEDVSKPCEMATHSAVNPCDKDAQAAAHRDYLTIHQRLTQAEDLYYFAVRCFIERIDYHAAKT